MNLLIRRLQLEWPAWLAVSFVALLPIRRLSEIPLSLFALMLPFLMKNAAWRQRAKALLPFVIPLFLCYWIPMVASSFDSYMPEKSWSKSLAAIRFPMAAISMGVLLQAASHRWLVLRWTAYVLVFWAADGFVQLVFGVDLFGVAMNPDRLNALFFSKYQFYGPVLAMLSPLMLEYARRRWPAWAWVVSFALILGAVMISGMRAGWLAMFMVLATYMLLMLRHENKDLRRASFAIPALALTVIAASYAISPMFQERVARTLAITQATEAALNEASSLRVPIFRASVRMYKAHPINGVGVRAFPEAYREYADADDYHLQNARNDENRTSHDATHAHNVVLEAMADTGSIGLLGFLAGMVLGWRRWRHMTPAHRHEAFPFVLALVLILFPLNSHFAIFGAYTSMLIWFLVGLWSATWQAELDAPGEE
jgi:O-antigen ligase